MRKTSYDATIVGAGPNGLTAAAVLAAAVGMPVRSVADVPQSHAVLFEVTPRQLEIIAGEHLSASYRARLRAYRYGTAALKIDYALAGPIPWRSPASAQSATVHLGGTYEEIAQRCAMCSPALQPRMHIPSQEGEHQWPQ